MQERPIRNTVDNAAKSTENLSKAIEHVSAILKMHTELLRIECEIEHKKRLKELMEDKKD